MRRFAALACAALLCTAAFGAIEDRGPVEFSGEIEGHDDLSAVAVSGDFLLIGSDETRGVQLLRKTAAGYAVERTLALLPADDNAAEMDIEAIAVDGNTVYVIGSHSLTRPRVKTEFGYKKNRGRLARLPNDKDSAHEFRTRNTLVRFELDAQGRARELRSASLREVLDKTWPFKLFRGIPSKENGVDIEGLAARAGKLYAGFRGPVLRGNYVPVLEFELADRVKKPRVLYVSLCGKGARDLTAVSDGFLILAGPVSDIPGAYDLYFWDGRDTVPGANPIGTLTWLGELPAAASTDRAKIGKAEGVALLDETASGYEVLVVFDGLTDGGARKYAVHKPRPGGAPAPAGCEAE
jgi:hypothetical protein